MGTVPPAVHPDGRPASRLATWPAVVVCFLASLAYVAVLMYGVRPAVGANPLVYLAVATGVGLLLCLALSPLDHRFGRLFRVPSWQYAAGAALLIVAALIRLLVVGKTPVNVAVNLAWFVIGVAFVEEAVFRGILWDRLGEKVGRWGVLAISTVLFTLMHVPGFLAQGGLAPSDLVSPLLWGLVCGLVRMATDGLPLPIAVHAVVDLLGH